MTGAVVVFGASRGLGRAIAIAAAEEGFPVVLACRRRADGETIAHQLQARDHRVLALEADVTDYDAVTAVIDAAHAFGKGLVGVVNNAGVIGPLTDLGQTDPQAWARAIEINLVGAYNGTRAALPLLADGGAIINLSSKAAHFTVRGWSAYGASKAGLVMLTCSTFAEYGNRLRVYGVQPGMVDTDMQAEIRAAGVGASNRVARRDLSEAGPPARAVAWLLRNRPADLSGQEVDLESVALRLRIGRERRTTGTNT